MPFISNFRPALITLISLSALTGCGIGTPAPSSSVEGTIIPAFTGTALGGGFPVVGSTVSIWTTGNGSAGPAGSTGYGIGTMLQEATPKVASTHKDTDSNGNFSFAGGFTCPSGQDAYIVASGGDPGGLGYSSSVVLLVAALGSCNTLYSGTTYTGKNVIVNEVTTVAAAYALGQFSALSATGGPGSSPTVLIGADATNNSALVSGTSVGCVNGTGTCTTTAAAGLAHAFANAVALVSPFQTSGGAFAGATGTVGTIIYPQQMVNTLANFIVDCVNSSGVNNGTTSTQCSNLFSATGTSTQANVFSALVALAANPSFSGSGSAAQTFYTNNMPSSGYFYTPYITTNTGIVDYSLAIDYPTALGITYPNTGALDINDVFYVGNTAASGTAPVNVIALSTGSLLATSATNSNAKYAFGLSLDALGNGYFGNASGSGTNAIAGFTTGASTIGGPTALSAITISPVATTANSGLLKVYASAVDLANNVWLLGQTNSGTITNQLYECPAVTFTTCTAQPLTLQTVSSSGAALAIDPQQNVWASQSQSLSVLENNGGSRSTPSYVTTIPSADVITTSGSPTLGISFFGASQTSYTGYISTYKSAGVAGVQPVTPTLSSGGVTAISGGTVFGTAADTGPYNDAADGLGTIWVADFNDHAIIQAIPGSSASYRLIPCVGGSTTCSTVFTNSGKPTSIAVDAAGSIWVTAPAGPNVIEVIGSAAPTWPLLSLGNIGRP